MKPTLFLTFSLCCSSALAWEVEQTVDKITHLKTVNVIQTSKERGDGRGLISIRQTCGNPGYEFILLLPAAGLFGNDNTPQLRIDKERDFEVRANPTSDNKALFFDIEEVKQIVDRLQKGKSLLIRFSKLGGESETLEFFISGLSSALKKAQKKCR